MVLVTEKVEATLCWRQFDDHQRRFHSRNVTVISRVRRGDSARRLRGLRRSGPVGAARFGGPPDAAHPRRRPDAAPLLADTGESMIGMPCPGHRGRVFTGTPATEQASAGPTACMAHRSVSTTLASSTGLRRR